MGEENDETAVVDQHCKVYGVDGLRIVDLSVLPSLVRRPPHATAIMVGERVAEFMREGFGKLNAPTKAWPCGADEC